jgi:MPBQ/MSBQ methyltransferase
MEATIKANTPHQIGTEKRPTEMIAFYEEATIDYEFWSKDLHMHYGYAASPLQVLNLSTMLEQMTLQVGQRLRIGADQSILDFGCGMGASLRTLASEHPESFFTGVNLVDTQIRRAKTENFNSGLQHSVRILKADFHCVPLPAESMDGTYAIESFCHAQDKNKVLEEMGRLLRSGGRLVIADCFLRRKPENLKGLARFAYNKMNELWHLPELPELDETTERLENAGFTDIEVENISMHVAPSVFYSPFKVLAFQWQNRSKDMEKERKNNIQAVLMASLLGVHLRQVGYFLIHATKS